MQVPGQPGSIYNVPTPFPTKHDEMWSLYARFGVTELFNGQQPRQLGAARWVSPSFVIGVISPLP